MHQNFNSPLLLICTKNRIVISSSLDETSFNDEDESYSNPSQSCEEGHEDKHEYEEDDSDDDEESYDEVKKPRIRTNLSRRNSSNGVAKMFTPNRNKQAITFSVVLHVKKLRGQHATHLFYSRLQSATTRHCRTLIFTTLQCWRHSKSSKVR